MTVDRRASTQTEFTTPATPSGSQPALHAFLPCSDCRQPMRSYYYALNGERPVCGHCKVGYAARIARGIGKGAFGRVALRATGVALGLGLALGLLLMAVGIVRIIAGVAIGWCVARVITKTTGDYYDRRYQYLAVGLTYLAIGIGSLFPHFVEEARARRAAATAVVADSVARPAVQSDVADALAEVDSAIAAEQSREVQLASTSASLLGGNAFQRFMNGALLIVMLPVIGMLAYGVAAAGLGVFVLGMGMYKAWDMTGQGVAWELSGPHRIGTGPISVTY